MEELNFDKEIDAILRKARPEEGSAVAAGFLSHLDADEISAFAENALPESAKMRCAAHFADCDRCRKILSNLILLRAEPLSEIVHAETSTAQIPWHRRLFGFPNLVYSLGALTLVFGALILFAVIQSVDKNMDVSQVSNKASAPAANANASSAPANMPANTPATNTTANFGSAEPSENTKSNLLPGVSNPSVTRETESQPVDDQNLAQNKPSSVAGASKNEEKVREDQKRAETDKNDADERAKTARQAPAAVLSDTAAGAVTKDAKKKLESKEGGTTSAGGKTFRRSNGVWYDSAYSGQSTINVARGSGAYKKLDSGLRSIAEKMSGTIVVVWKSKAYRIQ